MCPGLRNEIYTLHTTAGALSRSRTRGFISRDLDSIHGYHWISEKLSRNKTLVGAPNGLSQPARITYGAHTCIGSVIRCEFGRRWLDSAARCAPEGAAGGGRGLVVIEYRRVLNDESESAVLPESCVWRPQQAVRHAGVAISSWSK